MDFQYNTQQERIKLTEYGRGVQEMIEHLELNLGDILPDSLGVSVVASLEGNRSLLDDQQMGFYFFDIQIFFHFVEYPML